MSPPSWRQRGICERCQDRQRLFTREKYRLFNPTSSRAYPRFSRPRPRHVIAASSIIGLSRVVAALARCPTALSPLHVAVGIAGGQHDGAGYLLGSAVHLLDRHSHFS